MSRGAPIGNQNAAKAKKWTAAIERALQKRSGKALAEALDDLAEKFIAAVEKGDLAAFKELGDRLEGKPAQAITGPNGGELEHIHTIRRVIVRSGE
jgi:restriction endonuclease Mrr